MPAPVLSRKQHAIKLSTISPPVDSLTTARLPDALGKSILKYKQLLSPHTFYRIVDRARGRYKLCNLNPSEHPAASYLNHLQVHGANVVLDLHQDQA